LINFTPSPKKRGESSARVINAARVELGKYLVKEMRTATPKAQVAAG
jgi:hypothetical protein